MNQSQNIEQEQYYDKWEKINVVSHLIRFLKNMKERFFLSHFGVVSCNAYAFLAWTQIIFSVSYKSWSHIIYLSYKFQYKYCNWELHRVRYF